jgi:hypothetical protein
MQPWIPDSKTTLASLIKKMAAFGGVIIEWCTVTIDATIPGQPQQFAPYLWLAVTKAIEPVPFLFYPHTWSCDSISGRVQPGILGSLKDDGAVAWHGRLAATIHDRRPFSIRQVMSRLILPPLNADVTEVVSEELEQLLSAQFLWNPWCCLSLAAST